MKLIDTAQMYNGTRSRGQTELQRHEILSKVDPEFQDRIKSKKFFQARVQTNLLAAPVRPQLSMDGPIVVDINSSEEGRVGRFVPKVIVISGHKAFGEAHVQRIPRIGVWIGELAAKALDIQADHDLGSDELRSKLDEQLQMRIGPKTTGFKGVMTVDQTVPFIREVYPFEGYFIYDYRGKLYRQLFEVNRIDRSVALTGVPTEVHQVYSPMRVTSRLEAAADLYGCGCGGAIEADVEANKDDVMCGMKRGVAYSMGDMVKAFKSAIKKGYKPKIEAVAPPGWEGTVKKMKDNPRIDNPYALSWWMDEQGYEPG